MPEKRMLIVEADAVRKIDENRGDMSVSDFIGFLIDSQLKQEVNGQSNDHITKEEFRQFEQGMRELMRNFLEFFLSYGLELGKEPSDQQLEALTKKLQVLGASAKAESH